MPEHRVTPVTPTTAAGLVQCRPCELALNDTGVEFQCVNMKTPHHAELCIVTVYRPPTSSVTFVVVLQHILQLNTVHHPSQ